MNNKKYFFISTTLIVLFFINLNAIRQYHFALTGPASSGKTTILKKMKEIFENNCHIVPEAATIIKKEFDNEKQNPYSNENITEFQIRIILKQIEQFNNIPTNVPIIIYDRTLIDSLAMADFFEIKIPENIKDIANKCIKEYQFNKVFYYELGKFEKTDDRIEDNEEFSKKIGETIFGFYFNSAEQIIKLDQNEQKKLKKEINNSIIGKKRKKFISRTLSEKSLRRLKFKENIDQKLKKTMSCMKESIHSKKLMESFSDLNSFETSDSDDEQ